MPAPDYKELLGEIAAKHGFHMAADNPEWAIVTMGQGLLESTAAEMVRQIRTALVTFEEAAQKVQTRAGAAVAQEVRDCSAAIRRELKEDIEAARLNAREIVIECYRANRRTAMRVMGAVSLMAALALIFIGFLLGRLTR